MRLASSFTPCVLGLAFLAWSAKAHAYIGPGMGVGAAAAVLGILAAVILLIVGLVWYPIRRLRKSLRESKRAKGLEAPPS
jgi:hypothetical protein